MRLSEPECWRRLEQACHGVLATLHRQRGPDVVPVVYVLQQTRIVVPVDTVKDKRPGSLQRELNVSDDPRCSLIVEHYESDWSQLWWVRVHAIAELHAGDDASRALFAKRFDQYRATESIARMITLDPVAVTGWAATRA